MITKLGLHGAEGLAKLALEYDLVKLRHHHSAPETTEISAAAAGGALGMFGGQVGEISAGLDLIDQVLALGLCLDKNVACAGSRHVHFPLGDSPNPYSIKAG